MVRKEKSSTLQNPHPLLPLKPAGETEIRAATAVRGHWRIENRNYQKRDASLWQGDRHPIEDPTPHSP